VSKPDEVKGKTSLLCYLRRLSQPGEELSKQLKQHVGKEIGAIARPGEIRFDSLPKTRSGKIIRRLLRSVAAGQEISGDTSTLEDRGVLDKLRAEA